MGRKERIQRKRREGGRTEERERVGEMVKCWGGETKEGEEWEGKRKREGRAEGDRRKREREKKERE